MDTSTIQNIGIIFSIMLGVFTLGMSMYQARLSAQQMKSATSGTVFGYLMQLNQMCIEHAELELSHLGGNQFQAKSVNERKAQLLIDMHLTFIEEVFYQHQRFGAYTPDHWTTWQKVLENMGRSDYVRHYWELMRENFDPPFIDAVDRAFSNDAASQPHPVSTLSGKGKRRRQPR
jgi:hypothetical protein